jgi:hypothetical protein
LPFKRNLQRYTVGRFLSIQRTVTLMPFFLLGHAMRRHRIFFSW